MSARSILFIESILVLSMRAAAVGMMHYTKVLMPLLDEVRSGVSFSINSDWISLSDFMIDGSLVPGVSMKTALPVIFISTSLVTPLVDLELSNVDGGLCFAPLSQ